ncbi:hypothetical protein T484DRAFT_1818984, partial [Baffinella frigidus]
LLEYIDALSLHGASSLPALASVTSLTFAATSSSASSSVLYASSSYPGALLVFTRHPTTGSLTLLQTVLGVRDSLAGAMGIAVAADGLSLLVAAYVSGAVSEYTRSPASGSLSFSDSIHDGEVFTPQTKQ